MKKTVVFLMILSMMLPLAACGSEPASTVPQGETPSQTISPVESVGEETQNQQAGKKPLIVYFSVKENCGVDATTSASETTVNGNTVGTIRALADKIQAGTGGDLFSIRTSVVYPTDRNELIEFASNEKEQNARPELVGQIENLDEYDTIFVGYPNWWYDIPMAMYSFFDQYDLSGKTVIPFNTHNGSRFSQTIQTIQGLEPGATVVTDGFTVNERDAADADVSVWLQQLGY